MIFGMSWIVTKQVVVAISRYLEEYKEGLEDEEYKEGLEDEEYKEGLGEERQIHLWTSQSKKVDFYSRNFSVVFKTETIKTKGSMTYLP